MKQKSVKSKRITEQQISEPVEGVLPTQQIATVLEQCRRLQALWPRFRAMGDRESTNIADRESKDNAERTKHILKYSGAQPVAAGAAVPEKHTWLN